MTVGRKNIIRILLTTSLALKPVLGEDGERVQIMIHMRGREVYAQAWLAQIGRISLVFARHKCPE